ncbi:hypothetical protein ACFTY8_20305 [Streptomyces mirabilis]|uniref:hypothetical protein n=1 Tax=Streptomyces mirabilis TaxID=68239 RepID=UPI0036297DA3
MADQRAARSVRSRWTRRVAGCVVALLLTLATPAPALARTVQAGTAAVPPVTVPALSNWTPENGSYSIRPGSRIVGRDLLPAPVRARHWRLRVTRSRRTARIAEFALHRSRI